jgi:membrane protease YdiL (CAAX protease family)
MGTIIVWLKQHKNTLQKFVKVLFFFALLDTTCYLALCYYKGYGISGVHVELLLLARLVSASILLVYLIKPWAVNKDYWHTLGIKTFETVWLFRFLLLYATYAFLLFELKNAGLLPDEDTMPGLVKLAKEKTVLFVFAVVILGAGIEEFIFRGLLIGNLIREKSNPHVAVFFSAFCFAIIHLQYTPTTLLLIMPIGLILGYSRYYSGSIWLACLLHALHNSLIFLE